jgi:hypothetical protein
MIYSDFTLKIVKERFGLTLITGGRFLPQIPPATLTSPYLTDVLHESAPAVVIVEAKKDNIKAGFGQCIAEMIAAQQFNASANKPLEAIYGTVTTGNIWTFLKLEQKTVTIDLTDHFLMPVENLLGILGWMLEQG